jgi:hypothetical protein
MTAPKKTRFDRIRLRILAGELFKVIAMDERVTLSYVSKVRTRAGIARRVTPRPSVNLTPLTRSSKRCKLKLQAESPHCNLSN